MGWIIMLLLALVLVLAVSLVMESRQKIAAQGKLAAEEESHRRTLVALQDILVASATASKRLDTKMMSGAGFQRPELASLDAWLATWDNETRLSTAELRADSTPGTLVPLARVASNAIANCATVSCGSYTHQTKRLLEAVATFMRIAALLEKARAYELADTRRNDRDARHLVVRQVLSLLIWLGPDSVGELLLRHASAESLRDVIESWGISNLPPAPWVRELLDFVFSKNPKAVESDGSSDQNV